MNLPTTLIAFFALPLLAGGLVHRIEPNERRIGLSLRDLAADIPVVEEEEHRGRRGGRKRDRDRYDSDDDE